MLRTRPLSGWERIGIVLSVIWLLVLGFDWYPHRAETDVPLYGLVIFWAISTILAWVIVEVLFQVWRWIRRGFEMK